MGNPTALQLPPRTSTASLEVTGSTGGITAPHPTPNLLPAQSRGTRGLCIPPSLGSSKFFPNHLPTHKTFCAPLICVISLSWEIRSSFSTVFFFSSSEEAALKWCLKMCCNRFFIFMQDELNTGFFLPLCYLYTYI